MKQEEEVVDALEFAPIFNPLEKYNVDEFIFTCDIYDTDKRIQNFELLMDIKNS